MHSGASPSRSLIHDGGSSYFRPAAYQSTNRSTSVALPAPASNSPPMRLIFVTPCFIPDVITSLSAAITPLFAATVVIKRAGPSIRPAPPVVNPHQDPLSARPATLSGDQARRRRSILGCWNRPYAGIYQN